MSILEIALCCLKAISDPFKVFTEILNLNIRPIFVSKLNLICDIQEKVFHYYPLIIHYILYASVYVCVRVCMPYESELMREGACVCQC